MWGGSGGGTGDGPSCQAKLAHIDPWCQTLTHPTPSSSPPLQAVADKLPALAALAAWAPGSAVQGLQLISSPAGRHPAVKAYAVRCLENSPPEQVAFFLPQLVQALRADGDGVIASALAGMATHSDLFAHQVGWLLPGAV